MLILLVQGPTLETTAVDNAAKIGVSETVFSTLPLPIRPSAVQETGTEKKEPSLSHRGS